ncbi:hypothetical protein ACFLQN_01405 [Candidatus Aenigmatarchaeota archaeon]
MKEKIRFITILSFTLFLSILVIPILAEQIARPNLDVSNPGAWDDGGTVEVDGLLYNSIDEINSDGDTSYVYSINNPTPTEYFEINLTDVSDPDVDTGHVINFTAKKEEGTRDHAITVDLYQGGTLISNTEPINLTTSYQTISHLLETAEVSSIDDYSNLILRIIPNTIGGGQGSRLRITWTELVVPKAILEVNMTTPPIDAPTNLIQNFTFFVNATVYCRKAGCGNVNATVRYNYTSSEPNTPVNITEGDVPFFVNEPTPLATKSCSNNPLGKDDYCNLTWIINATGVVDSTWAIDVLFQSEEPEVSNNNTINSNATIIGCVVDFTTHWSSIDFGYMNPSSTGNAAPGNDNDQYNVSANPGSCILDFYIRGTNMTNETMPTVMNVGNITWSNTTNDYSESRQLNGTNVALKTTSPPGTNVTTWFWFDAPAVYLGEYNGTIYITGVEYGQSP